MEIGRNALGDKHPRIALFRLYLARVQLARNEAAAAEYYPPVYWLSMAKMPDKSEFPGTGHGGNGINEKLRSQQAFLREFMKLLNRNGRATRFVISPCGGNGVVQSPPLAAAARSRPARPRH